MPPAPYSGQDTVSSQEPAGCPNPANPRWLQQHELSSNIHLVHDLVDSVFSTRDGRDVRRKADVGLTPPGCPFCPSMPKRMEL